MNIIILAAGQGSRLKPYTNNIPKCLVEVAGKSFLARQIEIFESLGFDYPVIVAGYKAELIEKNYRKVLINQKYLSTNMLYSLFQAYQTILSGDDTIVCYGDIIFNANLIKLLIAEDSDLALVSDKNFLHYWSLRFEKPLDDLETFSFYENRLLKDIGGRPNSISEISGQYIGMFKISSNFAKEFIKHGEYMQTTKSKIREKKFEQMHMTDFFYYLIKQSCKINVLETDNGWLELDTVSDLELYESMHSKGQIFKSLKIKL